MNIIKTSNYKQFKYQEGNRGVSKGHVNQLIRSLRTKNMLDANPIIVSKNFVIIDGQHRLEAAKILQVPIYYVKLDSLALPEVQLLNSHQLSWSSTDYMNSYISMGKKDYEIYKQFREKYGFPHGTILALLMDRPEGGKLTMLFKEGEFKVVDLKKATEFADDIMELKEQLNYGTFQSRRFYQALFTLVNKNGIKIWDFTAKLKMSGMRIYPADNKIGYLRQFEDVLNKGRVGKRISLF